MRVRKPVQYNDFVRSASVRQRYWARSSVGWGRMRTAIPNPAHQGLARLEAEGHLAGLITQNVDGLHHAAGSRAVIELHGSLAGVVCLDCGDQTSRTDLQHRLTSENPDWASELDARSTPMESAPDGDAEVPEDAYASFVVPGCRVCDGMLKPDVVFFGENVPKERVGACWDLMDTADTLLVVGSSLTVFSGRRFVYAAEKRAMPVGVVNLGPTRADDVAAARVEGRLGVVLPRIADELTAR